MAYIIEHGIRGAYHQFDHATVSGKWGPQFQWATPRSEAEQFQTVKMAKKVLKKINEHISGCYILNLETGEQV